MSQIQQLRLVNDKAPGFDASPADPVRNIFEHWVRMSGRRIRLCKLGPTRRAAISAALAMGYDEDTLLLAIEGMACDPLEDCAAERIRDAMREIEWLLGREARIERWAERGERLRARAAEVAVAPSGPVADVVDAAAVLAARERLAALAEQMRRGGG